MSSRNQTRQPTRAIVERIANVNSCLSYLQQLRTKEQRRRAEVLAQGDVSFLFSCLMYQLCVHTHTYIFSFHTTSLLCLKSCNNSHFTQTINQRQNCSNILPELILITSLPLFYLLLHHWFWFPVLLQVFSQLLPPHWNLSWLPSLKLLSLYSQLSKPPLPWFIFFFFLYFCTYQFLKYFIICFLTPPWC